MYLLRPNPVSPLSPTAQFEPLRVCAEHSALLRAEEAVEHFLQAVDLALIDLVAGLDPIAEHGGAQAGGLSRQLHLSAFAGEHVAQDLTENVAAWSTFEQLDESQLAEVRALAEMREIDDA